MEENKLYLYCQSSFNYVETVAKLIESGESNQALFPFNDELVI